MSHAQRVHSCKFDYFRKDTTHFDKKNMFILDPGGLVHKDRSEGVKMMFKDMIRIKEMECK